MLRIRRREVITLLGGAATWPLAARAQRPAVIGYLNLGSPETNARYLAGLRRGLTEIGYVEGKNLTIEYRWGQYDFGRLPELANDLVRRQVAAIVTTGYSSAFAAKAATTTIPIVFGTGGDPVQAGLVASLNRPGGNLTGSTNLGAEVEPKRFSLLHDFLPQATRFAVLVNPTSPNTDALSRSAQAAASAIGLHVDILGASNSRELETAFAELPQKGIEALLVSPNNFLGSRRSQIVTLAALHRLPAIYFDRSFTEIGGLMSYGTDDSYGAYQGGIYAGRILKGAKPAELPVMQASKFELIINLQTARAFGLDVPPSLLALADEVIE
jgi:putative ABC transport system substrate-binding protein